MGPFGNGSDRAPQDSRLRSQKGGVEFINFPFGSFGSEICSEQWSRIRARIQKRQHRSRGRPRTQESRNLISEQEQRNFYYSYELWERSYYLRMAFLTRILGRMTPIHVKTKLLTLIVHINDKCSTLYGEPATRDTPICALTPPGTPLAVYSTCQEAESLKDPQNGRT